MNSIGLSLRSYAAGRLRLEDQGDFDRHDWGGCGCALED